MESLLELFVHVDDFCQSFLPVPGKRAEKIAHPGALKVASYDKIRCEIQ